MLHWWALCLSWTEILNRNPIISGVKLVVLGKRSPLGLWVDKRLTVVSCVSSSYFCNPTSDTTDFHLRTRQIFLLVFRGTSFHSWNNVFIFFWSSTYAPAEKNSGKLQARVSEVERGFGAHTQRASSVRRAGPGRQTSVRFTALSMGYQHQERHKHRLVLNSMAWGRSLSQLGNIHENRAK